VHVLVATDGSQYGVRAAQHGIELLGRPGRVTLLRVLTHVPEEDLDEEGESLYTPEQLEWHWKTEIGEAELARTSDAAGGVRVDERIEAGDVARTVCNVAQELHVDAIVVGMRNRSRLVRLFAHSVSENVVRHAPCPVLVVPETRATPRGVTPEK
jgi:nucleotide-binding universal stress UspA family protein